MIKKIKKWGNSLVIVFTSEDKDLYGMRENDIIFIDEMLFQKSKKAERIKFKWKK